jgi:hypothetical protein
VLVAYPKLDEGQSYVGMLTELGLAADVAVTGREAFQMLVRQPDYEFAMISEFIDSPRTSELIQMLRQDPRTASLPLAILVRPDQLDQVRGQYETDPIIEAFGRPFKTSGLDFVVQTITERGRRRIVGREERIRQAAAALDWMSRLTEHEHKYAFYDLRGQESQVEISLATPELSSRAALVLGRFGAPRSQQALLDFINQNSRPLPDRQAAADALKDAVGKRGLLLLRTSLMAQYDRYNSSAKLDAGTQALLGAVLDTLESKVEKQKKEENQAAVK